MHGNQPIPEFHPLLQNLEAEQGILGAALINSKASDEALSSLKGSEFTSLTHKRIFKVMLDAAAAGQPTDVIIVAERLRAKGWLEDESISYMSKMTSSIPTSAYIGHYIKIVKDLHTQREIIAELGKKTEEARQLDNPSEFISMVQSSMDALADQTISQKPYRSIRDIVPEVIEDLEVKQSGRDGDVTGVPSGFVDLDRMTAGFQRSDLIIIAARPSVGKTALGLNIAKNAAEYTKKVNESVAVFSLEMSEKQLVNRMICAECNIDASRFRTGRLTKEDWERVSISIGQLAELPILIDDTPAISVNEIRSKCRKIKRERGLGLIVIDYLQLVSGKGSNRQEEVSYISRTFKQIARELDVPVIALSQLSRGVEQRQDKRPMMSDLRESGSIEQDADIVAFLYRDDYYDKESDRKNIIEIIIAKQRNGPVGTVELAFLKQFNKFVNLDRSHHEESNTQSSTKNDPWWKVLGVLKTATSQEIEKAYRELSKKYHPDRGGSNELMVRINRAIAEARRAV
ncbi:replicative DNA helicase [Paenibacillus sp. IITD108]|uniref:replicative DNA helicase n=1 Tax=Paenibacillus sp. IITD108 TaxID=3116649 RepID=UPI002F4175C9